MRDWNTPAFIVSYGVPAEKLGAALDCGGTLGRCIRDWLDLPPVYQQDCEIIWGDPDSGDFGSLGVAAIRRHVRKDGPPPLPSRPLFSLQRRI